MEGYTKVIEDLENKFQSFKMEAIAGTKNQAAALRSRKLSMMLRDELKNFRVASVNNDQVIRTKKGNKESDE